MRAELLPAAWRAVQARLPSSAGAGGGAKASRRLAFLLAQTEEAAGAASSARAGGEGARRGWEELLGGSASGQPLALKAHRFAQTRRDSPRFAEFALSHSLSR